MHTSLNRFSKFREFARFPPTGPKVELRQSIYEQRVFHWGNEKRARKKLDTFRRLMAENNDRIGELPDAMRVVFYNRDALDEAAIVFTDRYGDIYQKTITRGFTQTISRFVHKVLKQADRLGRTYRLN